MSEESAAEAFARERLAGLDRRRERERDAVDIAVKAAVKEAQIDAQIEESRRRLDRINGSIDRLNDHLGQADDRMEKMEKAFGEFAAVAKAINDKAVTTRTFAIGVGMLLVAVVALFLGAPGIHA